MSEFSFSDLSLGEVKIGGGNRLAPGKYKCEVTDAEWQTSRSGGKMIVVSLSDVGGGGDIKTWLNVHVPSSPQATNIGRSQLKSLLVHGGHPDPDNIGDHGIASIKGLTTGVAVKSEYYVKDGETRDGSTVSYFCSPDDIPNGAASHPPVQMSAGEDDKLDDEIPF